MLPTAHDYAPEQQHAAQLWRENRLYMFIPMMHNRLGIRDYCVYFPSVRAALSALIKGIALAYDASTNGKKLIISARKGRRTYHLHENKPR